MSWLKWPTEAKELAHSEHQLSGTSYNLDDIIIHSLLGNAWCFALTRVLEVKLIFQSSSEGWLFLKS